MSTDDASLSEHEQRLFENIERSLLEDDPDFVKRVKEATPRRDSIRLLRLSIVALVVGFALLLAFIVNTAFGVMGFLLMVAGGVGVAVSLRNLAATGRAPGSSFLDAWKRAEARMRERRSKG